MQNAECREQNGGECSAGNDLIPRQVSKVKMIYDIKKQLKIVILSLAKDLKLLHCVQNDN